jgi:hypothetical protein
MIHRPSVFTTGQTRPGHLAAAAVLAGVDAAVLGALVALAMLVS